MQRPLWMIGVLLVLSVPSDAADGNSIQPLDMPIRRFRRND